MGSVISSTLGAIILFPWIIAFVFLVVMRKMGRSPATVIGLAADTATPFLFLAVYVISRTVIGLETGIYIATIAVLIVIVCSIIERFKVKEFQILHLLRKTWRLYFLVLTGSYFILLLTGIAFKIINYLG
ncbi:DUF3397 domain-containing protein [Filibacter tadaridae]|uniref:DUF3397 domain-containing protein n=1 Tax=Filibacter tadaridae TaxID=2483811 RepID=A0A3P5XER0_9BACL|nr:DUF3397 family protein [Filibacter tadaridae]VDC29851.1 hypothetical protein FILTAD_02403 [Filibacter tadaridae]